MKELTKKQQAVLDFIVEFITDNGTVPTLGEIGKRFDVSTSTVYQVLGALEKKGHVEHNPGERRSIKLKNYRVRVEAIL